MSNPTTSTSAPASNNTAGVRRMRIGHGFHPDRLRWLQDRYPEYLAAQERGHPVKFWNNVLAEYWETFNWKVALGDAPNDGPDREERLSPEDAELKRMMVCIVTRKIKCWFRYHGGNGI
ncbi:hypothetical protein DFH07DRAFT_972381 [Mycena maculata]|uniref:Uncharacterized protein n=1 Tax=Mycena maculata TaxID=230809 RepID=A0AAD7HJ74_9AGAR|nr:hypothetical protein DFH07DRAFT_972381 [Mycena maculata]